MRSFIIPLFALLSVTVIAFRQLANSYGPFSLFSSLVIVCVVDFDVAAGELHFLLAFKLLLLLSIAQCCLA